MQSPSSYESKQLEDEIFEKMTELRKLKQDNPDMKRGYAFHPGGILNAYRECDLTFEEAVRAIEKLIEKRTSH